MKRIKICRRRGNRSLGGTILLFLVMLVFALFTATPLILSISNSFKPLDELWLFPPKLIPINPTGKNYSDMMTIMSNSWVPFLRYLFNTVFITVAGTFGHVILSSLCAYALAKHHFPGQNLIFRIIVLSLMFSTAVTQVPSFLIMTKLHMINTFSALILPAFASSLGLYLMKQFMETSIPDALLESARIDGSGEWRTFWRIVMPLVKPAWLTLIIFSFQGLWNTGTNVLIQSEDLKTLNYALTQIVAGGIARSGTAAAATIVMMSVPVVIFVISQSNIVETMATSGMKD
mgnify:CR=1 FL=1